METRENEANRVVVLKALEGHRRLIDVYCILKVRVAWTVAETKEITQRASVPAAMCDLLDCAF
jgi:hypothetical protein